SPPPAPRTAPASSAAALLISRSICLLPMIYRRLPTNRPTTPPRRPIHSLLLISGRSLDQLAAPVAAVKEAGAIVVTGDPDAAGRVTIARAAGRRDRRDAEQESHYQLAHGQPPSRLLIRRKFGACYSASESDERQGRGACTRMPSFPLCLFSFMSWCAAG